MPKRAHYFDRYGREVAEHEAMRNGTLRDQFSMRVPTVFRDSRFRDAQGALGQRAIRRHGCRRDGPQRQRPGVARE